MFKRIAPIILLVLLLALLVACEDPVPETVEVTRIVSETEVPVEVTRVVEVEVILEEDDSSIEEWNFNKVRDVLLAPGPCPAVGSGWQPAAFKMGVTAGNETYLINSSIDRARVTLDKIVSHDLSTWHDQEMQFAEDFRFLPHHTAFVLQVSDNNGNGRLEIANCGGLLSTRRVYESPTS